MSHDDERDFDDERATNHDVEWEYEAEARADGVLRPQAPVQVALTQGDEYIVDIEAAAHAARQLFTYLPRPVRIEPVEARPDGTWLIDLDNETTRRVADGVEFTITATLPAGPTFTAEVLQP